MGVSRGVWVTFQDVAGQVHSSECPGGLAHSQGSVGSWSSEPRISLHTSLQVISKHLLPASPPLFPLLHPGKGHQVQLLLVSAPASWEGQELG